MSAGSEERNEGTKAVRLSWSGEGLAFRGGAEGHEPIGVDGDSRTGPSPMELVLLGVGGCMGIDVRLILEKSRIPLESLDVRIEGDRSPEPPRRYTAIRMHFRISGPSAADRPKVVRAIHLSRDKYCSVMHSLDPETPIAIELEIEAP